MRALALVSTLLIVITQPAAAETRLLRHPTVSASQVAFEYAGDLWVAPRDGGDARRLTAFPGDETHPRFSPDGRWVAFSGLYDGNRDVYVVAAEGGEPQRLTWHPSEDEPTGWTPDGEAVLFRSGRTGVPIPITTFWKVPRGGGFPEALPVPRAWKGKLAADGRRLAYQPIQPWDEEWRNYRGGQAGPVWVLDMESLDLVVEPWESSWDTDPVWLDGVVYFLSDRDHVKNVWAWEPETGTVRQVTFHDVFDAKNLEAGAGALVYECGGYLYLWQPGWEEPRQLSISVRGDLPWTRPHWEDVGDSIRTAALSPSGKRALFEARGDVFTVPVEEGDWRNLTMSSGVADRAPVWSPDGESIAWFSDEGGEYSLRIADQKGLGEARRIELTDPTFYFSPAWSPDSSKLLYTDEGRTLSYVDVESGEQTVVDTDQFAHPNRSMHPVWSPDSRWIAYAKRLDNQYHAIMVYSLDDGSIHQVTDAMSDVVSPAWDRGGKYLYFLASTNYGISSGWLDLSSVEQQVRREVYFAVLVADEPSPLLPKSDEEEAAADEEGGDEGDDEGGEAEVPPVRIDFDGIDQRILLVPAPSRAYTELAAGGEGTIFFSEVIPNEDGATLHKFSLEEDEPEVFVEGVESFTLSADGSKLLYHAGPTWAVVGTDAPPEAGDGAIDTALRMRVDPRLEWRQIFREAWRYQRDFFYVDNLHGADWNWVYDTYSPWVEEVGHRSDLTYLLDILGGEVSVGHSFTGGGDTPDVDTVPIGLLGADFEIDQGRYRLARILRGDNWNPRLQAPLSAPGVDVREQDYLLSVNGRQVTAADNLYAFFEATAGRQTILGVSSAPSGAEVREVTVVPVENEIGLRLRDWVQSNQRKVDELSGGRLAYVWLPNTAWSGYRDFNRYYFAQQERQGAVIDERFNAGGYAADWIVDLLSRQLQGFFSNPIADKKPFTNPGAGIWGPKVMVINESAGSGGDLLPWMFRNMSIGPLVGTRTWGGLVGIWDVPPLIDGGYITAPRGGFYTENGWAVENHGVPPDIEVEQTPKAVAAGHDPQLEAAVAEAVRLLEEKQWPQIVPQPPDPVRVLRPEPHEP